jgi:hypothetical protein
MNRRLEKTTSILSLVLSLIILATGIVTSVTANGADGYFAGAFIITCGVISIIVSNFLIWLVFHERK